MLGVNRVSKCYQCSLWFAGLQELGPISSNYGRLPACRSVGWLVNGLRNQREFPPNLIPEAPLKRDSKNIASRNRRFSEGIAVVSDEQPH